MRDLDGQFGYLRRQFYGSRESWKTALLSLLGGTLLWELCSRTGLLPDFLFPPPSLVLRRLAGLAGTIDFYAHLGATVRRIVCGFLAGAFFGFSAGSLCGYWRRLDSVVDPWISATYPLPKIALVPLLMILLGVGGILSTTIIGITAFYQIFILTRLGVSQVGASLVEAARNLGADDGQIFRAVVLPSMCPYLFLGAYLGLLSAIRMTIVVEALLSLRGIGRMMWISGEWLSLDVYYAYLVVLALLGFLTVALLRAAMRFLAPWAGEYAR